MIFRAAVISVILALATSVAICDTVVYQEDFSGAFVEHDWVYNNSSSNNVSGYDGLPWPGKVDWDGKQILGYEPTIYCDAQFGGSQTSDSYVGPLSGIPGGGWVGTGEVIDGGHNIVSPPSGQTYYNRCVKLTSTQAAYRNVTSSMQRSKQWVQCYMKAGAYGMTGLIYVGTTDAADVAAIVRFSSASTIDVLDGDGSGGGTWVTAGDYIRNMWHRIRIEIDYSTSTYGVAVDRYPVVTGMRFRDPGAGSGLNTVKFEHTGASGDLQFDEVYAGNSPYVPGPKGLYWSDSYNHWCVDYGSEIHATRDVYDWMSCANALGVPVNTDPDKPAAFKAALPPGWTAAFGMWGDWDPTSAYYASGRGKMGFGPLQGAYAQSPGNRCLHAWSSHGDMRIVSPKIDAGPGVYTLSWKAGVWNGNTAEPSMQYKWTDWCQWGFGYTNWCVWDGDSITTPPYDSYQVNQISTNRYWVWQKDPFRDSDPDGINPNVPNVPHPVGEEPGMWHSFTRTFAFGAPPVKGEQEGDNLYDFNQEPGWFIGFSVGHGHDGFYENGQWMGNQGGPWATILNVDDIVLTKKDPVSPKTVQELPVGSFVELIDMVIVNAVKYEEYVQYPKYLIDIYLEAKDRSGGVVVRVTDADQMAKLWSGELFQYELGDVVNVVGVISKDDADYNAGTQPDSRNPVKYITGLPHETVASIGSRLPAIIPKQENVSIAPLAISGRAAVGPPINSGLPTNGMLVTVFGRVNHSGADGDTFYVDDGTGIGVGIPGFSGRHGIKVNCRLVQFPSLPWDDSYVSVTGTIAAENLADHVTPVPVLYPRSQDDIVAVSEW